MSLPSIPSGSSNPAEEWNGLVIKTLFIKPLARELRHDEIFRHFSAFGDVENLRICSKRKCSHGFVKFTLAESAAKALGVDSHQIGGHRVKVVVAKATHQDLMSLLDLNDDCILEILSMKCLRASDLCSVAETCRRLKEIAIRAFMREHKTSDIYSLSEGESKSAKRIIIHFGSVIPRLTIEGGGYVGKKWSLEILAVVTEYCSSSTLTSLDLRDFEIPANFTAKLRPVFKNLQQLTMKDCYFEGTSEELLSDCGSLVELNMRDYREEHVFMLEKTFPKLEQFKCDNAANLKLLESFISRHKNLKSIKILRFLDSSVLQRIAECKQLETLAFRIYRNVTLDLANLANLRELNIFCHSLNVMNTAVEWDNLKLLEHLALYSGNVDSEFIGSLLQLRRLEVLKLWHCTGLQNLNRMGVLSELTSLAIHSSGENVDLDIPLLVKRLSKLNCLRVAVLGFEMDWAKYLRIVDVVRRRPDKSKLTIRFASFRFRHEYSTPDFSRNVHLVEVIEEHF